MLGHPELVFGWRTALMLVAVLHLLAAAVVLVLRQTNQKANRFLAVFLLVMVGILTPQMIGFAGFYAAFPWLSFAPFENALAIGPLLLGFTLALTTGRVPRWVVGLLLPALAVFAYHLFWFVQPLQRKWEWVGAVHGPYVQPVLNLLAITLAAFAVLFSVIQVRRYRAWLDRTTSVRAEFDPGWLSICLWVFIVAVLVWLVTSVIQAVWTPLSYIQEYPSYLFLAGSSYAIAQLALVRGREPFPRMPGDHPVPGPGMQPDRDHGDSAGRAREVREFVRQQRLYLRPRFSLAELARLRSTNQSDLSRLVNRGLGVNFNRLVNELRVEHACRRLRAGNEDILTIALESGFNSKATFNRVFSELRGTTPSAWRSAPGDSESTR